jgi:hypothetical protein
MAPYDRFVAPAIAKGCLVGALVAAAIMVISRAFS